MPMSSEKIRNILKLEKAKWEYTEVTPHISLDDVEILFTRFDEKQIAKELEEQEKEKAKKEKEELKKQKEAEKSAPKEQIDIDYLDKISLNLSF